MSQIPKNITWFYVAVKKFAVLEIFQSQCYMDQHLGNGVEIVLIMRKHVIVEKGLKRFRIEFHP